MSNASNRSGCAVGCLAIMALVLAVPLGRLAFAGGEVLARSFKTVGIDDPVVAWGLVGVVLGGLVGLIVGLRRSGRRKQLAEVALAILFVGALALVGLEASPFAARPRTRTVETPTVLFTVAVQSQALNVRRSPSSQATPPIDEVARGTRLDVLEISGNWYRVRYAKAGTAQSGWVHSNFVERLEPQSGQVNQTRQ